MTSTPKTPQKKANRAGFRLSAARLAAVQALYEIEIAGGETDDVLRSFIEKRWRDMTLFDPDSKPDEADKARLANPDPAYLTKIVEGVSLEKRHIVEELDSVLTGQWTTERLDALMRTLLFAASYEFIYQTEVPKRVVISEYTDLAHAFYEDNDASFAVGILSALAARFRPEPG
ncbi:MAG: transcription antitermination factor NusB [Rhodospirillales bacterium]|nr:transcription antitermination factor NusB [Rhodospirillales bacterium]